MNENFNCIGHNKLEAKGGGEKGWEFSICSRNCSQGSCSYFHFPLIIISLRFI